MISDLTREEELTREQTASRPNGPLAAPEVIAVVAPPSTAGTAGTADSSVTPAARPSGRQVLVLESSEVVAGQAAAAAQLGVPTEEVVVRVLARRKKGFLGLGGEILTIEATWEPPVPPVHGQIELTCHRGTVSMSVSRPFGKGRAADVKTLNEQLTGWPLSARDETVVMAALRAANGQPYVFATIGASVMPAPDAPAAVRLTNNGYTAWLIPWMPTVAERDALEFVLNSAGVCDGVNHALLDTLAGTVITKPVLIAESRPVRDGADARPELTVQPLVSKGKPIARPRGLEEARALAGAPTVLAGEPVVKKIAAEPGEDGINLSGERVVARPAEDCDLSIYVGDGTALNEDGSAVLALRSGVVTQAGTQLNILPLYVVNGDLGADAGTLEFDGDVVITAGLTPGAHLKVGGNVHVTGSIESSTVEVAGDLVVVGYILGHPKPGADTTDTIIRVGGSLTVHTIDGADIVAQGVVSVEELIQRSTVISEAHVSVASRGQIMGGVVRGRLGVEASVLGSPTGAAGVTAVQAGWGETMTVEVGARKHHPKVVARQQVNSNVAITVYGATHRSASGGPGAVFTESHGKINMEVKSAPAGSSSKPAAAGGKGTGRHR